MNLVFVAGQFLLLGLALPLALVSRRTTRALRSRHQALMALAAAGATAALLLALFSLSTLATDEPVDPWLTFAPPVATLLLCGSVLWRGLSSPSRRRRGVRTA